MPQIKIHPPKQLPETEISEQDFQDWCNELEIWLGGDNDMARFMQDGIYSEWQSQERNPVRIQELSANDPERPAAGVLNRDDVVAELLRKRRRVKSFHWTSGTERVKEYVRCHSQTFHLSQLGLQQNLRGLRHTTERSSLSECSRIEV